MSTIYSATKTVWKNDELIPVTIKPRSKKESCPIIEHVIHYLDLGLSKDEILNMAKEEGLSSEELMNVFQKL